MRKKIIIPLIEFLDKNNIMRITNPIHIIFYVVILFPIFYFHAEIFKPIIVLLSISIGLQLFVFFLKLLVRDIYEDDIKDVKDSIPDFNLFHIVMILLIFSPFIWIILASLFEF